MPAATATASFRRVAAGPDRLTAAAVAGTVAMALASAAAGAFGLPGLGEGEVRPGQGPAGVAHPAVAAPSEVRVGAPGAPAPAPVRRS